MTTVCNGFKLRPLNADCVHLAVQSSQQTTWLVGYRRFGIQKVHELAIDRDELIVLKAYGGCPAFEVKPLGDAAGVLVCQQMHGATRTVRVGSWYRVELDREDSCVIRCGGIIYPTSPGVGPGAYGPGLAV